jgi:hypothetical protein
MKWNVGDLREHVLWNSIQMGSITVSQSRFCYELNQQEPYLQMQSTDGEGKGVKKALSPGWQSPVCTPENIA